MGLLLLLSVASFSIAENRGVSHLGMCHEKYDCRTFESSFKGSSVIRTGWLDHTFNPKSCKCLPVLQKTKKDVIARVHILNGSGLRNRRLERFEIHSGRTVAGLEKSIQQGNTSFLARFDRRAKIVASQLDSIITLKKCYVSPVLESDFNPATRKILLKRTAVLFPNCEIVDNPLKGRCVSGYICEKHGDIAPLKGRYIVDLDGLDMSLTDPASFGQWHEKAELAFVWKLCNNLNDSSKKEFIPPSKRNKSCNGSEAKQFANFINKKGE